MLKFVAILLSGFLIANAVVLSEYAFGTTEKNNTRTGNAKIGNNHIIPLQNAKVCSALQKKWDARVAKAEQSYNAELHKWRHNGGGGTTVQMGSPQEKKMASALHQYDVTIQQMELDQVANNCPQTFCKYQNSFDGSGMDLCLNKNPPKKLGNKELN